MRQSRQRSLLARGFTLIELLVVVIILAILAAIVIPQFSSASTDTQEAALDANLAAMRNAIELYRVQHKTYPGGTAAVSGTGCANTGITGAIDTEAAVKNHLLMYSDADGKVCDIGSTTFKFGPYLRKGIPPEPINNKVDIAVTATGAPITATTAGGWAFDTKSGQLIMNSSANDSRSQPFSKH